MNKKVKYSLTKIDEISQLIVDKIKTIKTIMLRGELGSGKTTIVKSVLKKIGVNEVVTSPTFSIVNEYNSAETIVYHFDLYRLKSVSEFLEIGGIEYLSSTNGICIIEWPELINSFDIENKFKILFKMNNNMSSRTIEVYK